MSAPDLIVKILTNAGVIPERYTGQVVLHIGNGGLCNVEMREKPKGSEHFDRLCGMNEIIFQAVVVQSMGGGNNVSKKSS